MKNIKEKIFQERRKYKNLRSICFDIDYEKALKIREENKSSINKIKFLQNLDKAISKIKE